MGHQRDYVVIPAKVVLGYIWAVLELVRDESDTIIGRHVHGQFHNISDAGKLCLKLNQLEVEDVLDEDDEDDLLWDGYEEDEEESE